MLNILLADDSHLVRHLMKLMLSDVDGWSICGEAVNGEELVLLAARLKPDVVVTDLNMPALDGIRASAEIRKLFPALPIVLYTLHDLPTVESQARKVGITAVVQKTESKSLIKAVRNAVAASATPLLPGHCPPDLPESADT
jgi:DNA-binding NarL/FixJ family response regulator